MVGKFRIVNLKQMIRLCNVAALGCHLSGSAWACTAQLFSVTTTQLLAYTQLFVQLGNPGLKKRSQIIFLTDSVHQHWYSFLLLFILVGQFSVCQSRWMWQFAALSFKWKVIPNSCLEWLSILFPMPTRFEDTLTRMVFKCYDIPFVSHFLQSSSIVWVFKKEIYYMVCPICVRDWGGSLMVTNLG